jgi:hypothetical protein
MTTDTPDKTIRSSALFVLGRLSIMFLLLFLISFTVYFLEHFISDGANGAFMGFITFLFTLPFCIGALGVYLIDPKGKRTAGFYGWFSPVLIFTILIIGGIALREGVICLVMLAAFWLPMGIAGSYTTFGLHNHYRKRHTVSVSLLIALPFISLVLDANMQHQQEVFSVERSIIIDASPQEVWPHLLRMEELSPYEGKWNVTQDVLRIPRPYSAIVNGDGIGARRHAQWGNHITFEEVITQWQAAESLRWDFSFPNDSVHQHTDRHINPDGPLLKIRNGGYRLEELGPNRTRLILDTSYRASTPVNPYAALWGELILGDIQSNILKIVKDRAETQTSRS